MSTGNFDTQHTLAPPEEATPVRQGDEGTADLVVSALSVDLVAETLQRSERL